MDSQKNKENFLKLVSKVDTGTMKRNQHRIRYRRYYRIKQKTILTWLVFKDWMLNKLVKNN